MSSSRKEKAIVKKTTLSFRRAALFFALLFCLFNVFLSYHHHDDGSFHDDCPLCMAVVHLPFSAGADASIIVFSPQQNRSIVIARPFFLNQAILHSSGTRAPPA
jgi:hypothetical protein